MFRDKGIIWQLVAGAIRETGGQNVYFYTLRKKQGSPLESDTLDELSGFPSYQWI